MSTASSSWQLQQLLALTAGREGIGGGGRGPRLDWSPASSSPSAHQVAGPPVTRPRSECCWHCHCRLLCWRQAPTGPAGGTRPANGGDQRIILLDDWSTSTWWCRRSGWSPPVRFHQCRPPPSPALSVARFTRSKCGSDPRGRSTRDCRRQAAAAGRAEAEPAPAPGRLLMKSDQAAAALPVDRPDPMPVAGPTLADSASRPRRGGQRPTQLRDQSRAAAASTG